MQTQTENPVVYIVDSTLLDWRFAVQFTRLAYVCLTSNVERSTTNPSAAEVQLECFRVQSLDKVLRRHFTDHSHIMRCDDPAGANK